MNASQKTLQQVQHCNIALSSHSRSQLSNVASLLHCNKLQQTPFFSYPSHCKWQEATLQQP
jgi:hypothetical protein